ncbi:MAG: hypothetical protein JNL66_12205 [Alphaproteobacteria bacterium]|nr:hypothetical protein [Alphaproteobacteria bacterium]
MPQDGEFPIVTIMRAAVLPALLAACAPAGPSAPAVTPAAQRAAPPATTVPGPEWEVIAVDEARQIAVAIDWSSFARAGERRRVRVLVNNAQPGRAVRSVVAEQEIDCARHAGRALRTTHYGELAGRGETVWSTAEPVALRQWMPGTLGDAMNIAICTR